MYIWATTTPYMNRFSQGYLDYELSEWKLKLAILVVTVSPQYIFLQFNDPNQNRLNLTEILDAENIYDQKLSTQNLRKNFFKFSKNF